MTELTNTPMTSVLEKLSRKEISSEELTKEYLQEISSSTELGAFISVHEEDAIRAAKAADAKGGPDDTAPLRGLPLAVKDIFTLDS